MWKTIKIDDLPDVVLFLSTLTKDQAILAKVVHIDIGEPLDPGEWVVIYPTLEFINNE